MYNELNGIEMATDNLKNVEFIHKWFGTGTVNIEQFVNGNGIYVEKIENHYQTATPKAEQEEASKNKSTKPPFSSGRKQEELFIDAQENNKDEKLTKTKAEEFVRFLKEHHWASLKLDAKKESHINQAILAFYKKWQSEGLIAKCFYNARAIFRFLNEDCGISNDVTIETFANAMRKWLQDIPKNEVMENLVDVFYEK